MRLLRRNTTEFEYLPYSGTETDLNDDGEHTGEFRPEYGDPVIYRGNISSPSGHTVHQFYGEDIRYTHTLVLDNPNADIEEHGMIRWKNNLYEITAVRPSLNVLSVALRRITGIVEDEQPEEVTEEPEEEITGETGALDGDGE